MANESKEYSAKRVYSDGYGKVSLVRPKHGQHYGWAVIDSKDQIHNDGRHDSIFDLKSTAVRLAEILSDNAETPRQTFDLLGLYYELGGIGWNAGVKLATFPDQESALKFKHKAPHWEVRYLNQFTQAYLAEAKRLEANDVR